MLNLLGILELLKFGKDDNRVHLGVNAVIGVREVALGVDDKGLSVRHGSCSAYGLCVYGGLVKPFTRSHGTESL